MLFLQSHDVYQFFEKVNEQVQAEIVNLASPGDLFGLDLYIYRWTGQVELCKARRPSSSTGSLVPIEE
jgi:hypothetical protein